MSVATTSATGWADLVTTALLGTQRRPLPDSLPASVARLGAGDVDPAVAVLDVAAGYANRRHAGTVPGASPEPPVAPRQSIDPAPEAAHQVLATLLPGGDDELLAEWLRTCVARGLGVRPGLWADLAARAVAAGGVDRGLVCRVLGERGVAFLELHPRLRVVAGAADPGGVAGARRLLADAWADLPGPRRAVLLDLVATAPEPADEPLLRRALSERRGDVREAAVRGLSRLPGSDWSRWATGRATEHVEVTRELGRRRVVVHPPQWGADDATHGLVETPPRDVTTGRAAYLLRQLLAGADLAAWEEHTRCDPEQLLALVRRTAPDWYVDLARGFAAAAAVQRNEAWAEALLDAQVVDPALVTVLAPERVDRLVRTWGRAPAGTAEVLVGAVPGPWSRTVSETALALLTSGHLGQAAVVRFSRHAAHRLDLDVRPALAQLTAHGRAAVDADRILAARVEIHRSFDSLETENP
jgi:hypothetical protein